MTEGFIRTDIDYSYRDKIPKTEFTKAHIEIFKTHSERWKRDAYSTRRIDKPLARAAIKALYRLEGRTTPFIIWTKSPLANIIAKVLSDEILGLTARDRKDPLISSHDQTLWCNIGPSVIASVQNVTLDFEVVNRDALQELIHDGSLWGAFGRRDNQGVDGFKRIIKDDLYHAIRLSSDFIDRSGDSSLAGELLWTDICDAIVAGLGKSPSQISDKTYPEETRQQLSACLLAMNNGYGSSDFPEQEYDMKKNYISHRICCAKGEHHYSQFNIAKLSEYKCLADAELIPCEEKLKYLNHLCRSVGWVLPSQKACFVSERPKILKVDDRGLPHCEDGPAIEYPDGFSIYAWHGLRFPKKWITQTPSPSEALNWPNLEQRRVACELVGWENIIDKLNGRVIDKDTNPEIGELVRVNLPDSSPEKFLRVVCGTGRKFAMPVPPNMQTARQANAWTWGLEPDEYNPEIRT